MPKTLELSQAISTRLCHDLAGSVGTIDNCLSLFENSDKSISEKAKNLVEEESTKLISRLKVFRSAYGLGGEQEMSLVHLSKLLIDCFKNIEIKLNLHFEEGIIYIESHLAKATICLTSLAAENINSKGIIDLYINKDIENPIQLQSDGYDLQLKTECIEILNGKANPSVNVINCREHYINRLYTKKGYKLSVSKKGGSIKYNLLKK